MDSKKLAEILAAHKTWLTDFMQGSRAKLSGADLRGAVLSSTDLSGAVLSSTDLSGADLSRAKLSGADLRGAVLRDADLSRADLRDADLRGADLSRADLSRADLSGADLRGAKLSGAVLRGAVLSCAKLSGADLRGAKLSGADLSRAVLRGVKIDPREIAKRQIVAQGEIIVYKKLLNNKICKLLISKDTPRVGGLIGRKCRAQSALVIEGSGFSVYDNQMEYREGEIVTATNWNPDPLVDCAGGIHFFLTREEAEDYT